MKTKPKTKKAVRREVKVKAWAVLRHGKLGAQMLNRPSGVCYSVFYYRHNAESYADSNDVIVPCTISYSLPRLTKKKWTHQK